MADNKEAKAVRGASLLILLQWATRIVTFLANQTLIRYVTAELLGISTHLDVYYLSIIIFSRESLRSAIQRQGTITSDQSTASSGQGDIQARNKKDDDDDDTHQQDFHRASQAETPQAIVNLAYLVAALGLPTAAVLGWMYVSALSEETLAAAPNLVAALCIYALATILELLSEPAFAVLLSRLQFGARAGAEWTGTILKCFVTLASAVWASWSGLKLGVLPFAFGQAAYGAGLLGVYAWHGIHLARAENFSLLPRRLGGSGNDNYMLGLFYRPTLNLASSMMVQSFVKHWLTQGDTVLVATFCSTAAQGVYAIANNWGSLLARMVLSPLEEIARNYFSNLLSDASAGVEDEKEEQSRVADHDSTSATEATPLQDTHSPVHQAAARLTSVLKFYVLISLPVVALGPVAAPLVLSVLVGPQWASSGAGDALAAYVYYIPLLAVNGLTEAFVTSTATQAQVHRQSAWMAGFFAAFAAAGYVFMHVLDLGAVGLVAANSVNMACRIVWAASFIRAYFGARGVPWSVADILPRPASVAVAAVMASVVRRAAADVLGPGREGGFRAVAVELVKIAGVAVPFLPALAFTERKFLVQVYQFLLYSAGKRR